MGATGVPAPPPGSPAPAAIAETTRGDRWSGDPVVESRHHGHVVVACDGGVVATLGDPAREVFVRSAVKPFQAAGCLEVLAGPGTAAVPEEGVAVACASHRAEPRHLAAVAALLRAGGLVDARGDVDWRALTCPPDTPPDAPGAPPRRRYHNCSGKHALFAVAGTALGLSRREWLAPDGALQQRVLEAVSAAVGEPVALGVDGCGAPTAVVALQQLATGFASLATDERWARVRAASLARPGLVGGRDRLETALLAHGVLAKPGAEGVFGAGWVDERRRAWGVAVRTDDGAGRGAQVALAEVVRCLAGLPDGVWTPSPVLGGGRAVGVVRPTAAVHELVAAARSAK